MVKNKYGKQTLWVPGSQIKPLKEPVPVSLILPTGHPCYPLTI